MLTDILESVYAQAKTLLCVWLFSSHFVETLYGFVSSSFVSRKFFPFLFRIVTKNEYGVLKERFHYVKIEIWVSKGEICITCMNFNNDTFQLKDFAFYIWREETMKKGKRDFCKIKFIDFPRLSAGNFHIET